MYNEVKHFIGGEWVKSTSKETIAVIDPSTGEEFGKLARGTKEDIDRAVNAAEEALKGSWGNLSASDRGKIMKTFSRLIFEHADELAEIEVRDVGKPRKQAKADAIACSRYFEFYGESCDKILGDTIPFLNGYTVLTVREPHGVTGHIVPWNYPMQIIGRSVAAALAMGNACVIKPAEDASFSALYLAMLAKLAGFPEGAINIVTGLGSEAGAALTEHPGIHHISFTGSNAVGKLVQIAAAKNTIPVTLELGGKSPQLVFDDADLDTALPFLVNASIQNAGQTCSAGSRLIVQEGIYDEVISRVSKKFQELKVGTADQDLDIGPVINHKQMKRIQEMIENGKKSGLKVIAEAFLDESLPKNGCYVTPTVFTEVNPEHELAREEIFGPVLVIIKVKDEEEAIRVANGTNYGLVAGIWTKDGSRALRVSKKIQAGQVFINNYGAAGGIELPFGGVKGSGHGREKGLEALYGFSVVKTIAIKHD